MQNSLELTDIANRYRIIERLGSGGMGVVYRAYDRLSSKHVALKMVLMSPDLLAFNPSDSDESDPRLALTREFQALAALRHPHIISVLDYGFTEAQTPFLRWNCCLTPSL